MKESRKLLNKAGLPLFCVVIAFSVLKEYVISPIISEIWKLSLMTTPDGFISNANLGRTLIRSPWIIVIGFFLLGIFLLFTMWQVTSVVLGVAYVYEGKIPKIKDLLVISAKELFAGARFKNSMLLVYTVIILPFTNLFQASEMISAFIIPEYIKDYIDAKLTLYILYWIVFLVAIYFAIRLVYILPAFFLKKHDFKAASAECFEYSLIKAFVINIRIGIYGFIESVRLAILPFALVVLACVGIYVLESNQPFATIIYASLPLPMSKSFLTTFCGVMVYLSSMCYVIRDYYQACEKNGTMSDIKLPELPSEAKRYISGRMIDIAVTFLGTTFIVIIYVLAVWLAKRDPQFLDVIINNPEVVAHKGYSSIAPENTMDAFELADKTENANYIELDVWSSKDGVPVVLHNETITAATGLLGPVYDYTYEELCDIPAPYSKNPEEYPNARIPSLEEVIATYADTTPLIIEIKGYKKDDQLPAKIVALMEKYNITDTSMIHSGDYGALKAVKLINPNIKCGLILAIVTGDCYDLPYADFFSVEHTFVTSNMVDQLHKRDKEIYVWTVNYKESVDSLKSVIIDGYITDYPDDIAKDVKSDIELDDIVYDSFGIDNIDDFDQLGTMSEYDKGNY